jgi:anti-sigma B factor antagonist
LQLETEEVGGILVALYPAETLDVGNVKDFRKAVEPILKEHSRILFDLEVLQFVDSSGLGALLHCLREMEEIGGELKVCSMSKSVMTVFEMVRLHRTFEIFNSREEALEAFEEGEEP